MTSIFPNHKTWYPTLPQDWQRTQVKYRQLKLGSGKTPSGGSSVYLDAGIALIRSLNVYDDGLRTEGLVYIDEDTDQEMANTRLKENDVLLNITGASIGRSCIVPRWVLPANVNQHVCIIRPSKEVFPQYLAYVLKSALIKDQIAAFQQGSSREGLNFAQVGNLAFLLPPFPVQKAIASFLDRKTAAIDTLITKKQRLIQFIEEKRIALINQAVTKGLNSNAPTKDSGIPWIGNIPKHWDVKKLKWLSPYISVGIVITPAKYYVDNGIPCLRSLNIRPGKILGENFVYISEESNELLSKSKIFKGDLVCVRTGQPGTTAVVDERFNGTNCIDLIIIRQSLKASSEYLSLLMNSEVCRFQYLMGSSGAIQQHFNVETAANLIVCNPPLDEQLQIVEYCHRLIERYHGSLTQKVSEQIDKLHEYRQSLITAAVTGKIDISQEVAA